MERLTRANISVDKDTDRYLNAKIGMKEFEWSTASDSVIDLILNGPVLMGFRNDVLRKIIRELYVRLKPYEDLGLEPWQADAAKNIVEMAFEDKPERAERIRGLMFADKAGILVFPEKYPEIWALFYFCVESGIKCTMERLYDGYAVRFPNGGDFAQHYGTYGGTEGSVEPAIGDAEFDYSAVGINLAKTLVEKHKSKLQAEKTMKAMKDG